MGVEKMKRILIAGLLLISQIASAASPGMIGMTSSATTSVGDPYFSDVVLLMNFDGDLTDEVGHTVTSVASAAYTTDDQKFGAGSVLLNGTSQYLYLADSADWVTGANPFTIEIWWKAVTWKTYTPLVTQFTNNASTSFLGGDIRTSGTNFIASTYYGSTAAVINETASLSTGVWYYTSTKYDGNAFTVRGGSSGATSLWGTTTIGARTLNDGGTTLKLGANIDGTAKYSNIYIGGVRFTNGTARDDSQVPTAAFPTF
jgi:hypothetical protein